MRPNWSVDAATLRQGTLHVLRRFAGGDCMMFRVDGRHQVGEDVTSPSCE